jgi:hypothetical protein
MMNYGKIGIKNKEIGGDNVPESKNIIEDLMYKISNSVSCSCLFALEESFNKIGLTLQTTVNNRTILCRVEDGKPCADVAIDDYIFIGKAHEDKELGQRTINCILEFVGNNIGEPVELIPTGKSYHNNMNLYGNNPTTEEFQNVTPIIKKSNKLAIDNEDVNSIAGDIDG